MYLTKAMRYEKFGVEVAAIAMKNLEM